MKSVTLSALAALEIRAENALLSNLHHRIAIESRPYFAIRMAFKLWDRYAVGI